MRINLKIPEDLKQALQVIIAEGQEDYGYAVRDNEGLDWDGPRITAFAEALNTIKGYLHEDN